MSHVPLRGSRRWCFTLNNWTESEFDRLVEFGSSSSRCRYLCFASEVGEVGTPHLQGYVVLTQNTRLTWLRNHLCDRAHFEHARGSSEVNKKYCSKEGSEQFTEFGDCPSDGGAKKQACDWEKQLALAKDGKFEEMDAKFEFMYRRSTREIYEEAQAALAADAARNALPNHPLRPWQAGLDLVLATEPHPRQILWYYDPDGDKGKSWYSLYYHDRFPESTQIMCPARALDLAYLYKVTTRVLFFDCPKGRSESTPWSWLEHVKNGLIISSKYDSVAKRFKPPHVVVLANCKPPEDTFAQGRIKLMQI